ncbi:hypothetical protein SAMN02745179_01002 [Mycoplasmopsis agassizii]|uniref:Uncharacterized protein n=2 Tax=Mycoplasmopsis agassizii TaxID=33922 RepID=A0ABX4H4L2_9BACT|nr:hypothetical protein CJF60_03350 [Mycoplasmopsis agassizii]SMC20080.1 hypothetical protein SAMN02745179_01002 [Mycoplasmopsis agassizii]
MNISVENVHPIIVFVGKNHYYFMALQSYKDKHKNIAYNLKKIILEGQGEGYQMSIKSIIDNDVIYKVEKNLLNKNVFSEQKTKVKLIKSIEIKQIFDDLSKRLLKTPPEIALAEITLNKYKNTETKIIYASNSVMELYKNAYVNHPEFSLSYLRDFEFMFSEKQVSKNFINHPTIQQSELVKELEDLKSMFVWNIQEIINSNLSVDLSKIKLYKFRHKLDLGALNENGNSLGMK